MWTADQPGADGERLRSEMAKLEQEIVNLADAIAAGVDAATMRAGIGERTAKKAGLSIRLQEASGRAH